MVRFAFLLLTGLFLSGMVHAQSADSTLRAQIQHIAQDAKGTVGFAMLGVENRDTVSYNGRLRLPMQSVMKFPIAITMLNAIDEGKFTLDQRIHVTEADLPPTYSPLRDKFPHGTDIAVSELLSYMVSQSDNDACDILLKLLGGPEVVENYMHSFGVKQIAVKASEYDMAQSWDIQFSNWCQPREMMRLLDIASKRNFLSTASHAFLWKIMEATITGPNQIKGLLPPGTVVAHKTGRSGTNDKGISAATNDVGVITLPNGKHLIVSIFVSNSSADMPTRESVIARLAKAAYDYQLTR